MPTSTQSRGDADTTRDDTTDPNPKPQAPQENSEKVWLPGADRITVERQRGRAPHYGLAGTIAAGYAASGLSELVPAILPTPYPVLSEAAVAAFSASASLGTLIALRWRFRDLLVGYTRRYWIAAVAATLWIAVSTCTGVGAWSLGLWLTLGYALSTGWLRAHAPRFPQRHTPQPQEPEPGPAAEEPPFSELERYAELWHRRVKPHSGSLKGSLLTAGEATDHVLSWTIELQHGDSIAVDSDLSEFVASALNLDPSDVFVEPQPADADGKRNARLGRLQIVTSSPVIHGVTWQQPMYRWDGDTLAVQLGPHGDGRGWGEYHVLSENSAWNGVVIGSSGVGKSALMSGLIASTCAAVPTVVPYLDPKRVSNPDLLRNATVAAPGLDRVEQFTTAIEEYLHGRQLEADYHGWAGFTPSPERPLVQVVIDECDHVFADKKLAERWGRIAKTGRALGICLLVASQYAGQQVFGNNEVLRSNLANGNIVLMRTESNTSDGLIAKGMPSSRTLPAAPGYGYLKNQLSRVAQFRGAYLIDGHKAAQKGGYSADDALRDHPDAALDEIDQIALGPLLTHQDKDERARAHRERAGRLLEEWKQGKATTAVRPPSTTAPTEDTSDVEVGEVTPFPAPPKLDTVADEVASPAPSSAVSQYATGVLAVISDGALTNPEGLTRTHEIVRACGWSRDTVAKALRELQCAGLITPGAKQGQWTLAEQSDRESA